MTSLGMILDLTHCADAALDEALALFPGPVIASHSNVRSLVPRQRQLPDRHLEAIAARGGVIADVAKTSFVDAFTSTLWVAAIVVVVASGLVAYLLRAKATAKADAMVEAEEAQAHLAIDGVAAQ